MDHQHRAVFIFSQSISCMAEIEGMKAENQMREMKGQTIAYGKEAFLDVIKKYGLEHNSVVSFLS